MRHGDTGLHGSESGDRDNVLWGDDERGLLLPFALILIVAIALLGARAESARAEKSGALVPQYLLDAAAAHPDGLFDVIVQGTERGSSTDVADEVRKTRDELPGKGVGVKRGFLSIDGSSAQLTGKQLLKLANRSGILAITEDAPTGTVWYENPQVWPAAAGARNWDTPPPGTAYSTIAIVDSGVQSRGEFGSRLLKQVDFVSSGVNSPGDGRGHGTLVASIASNGGFLFTGAEPRANLVSLDVLDDAGNGVVSDVIAACDWILAHKDEYNIRVANFSINAGGTFFWLDPLDRAVESLWLNGVVVVVAAGNYGTTSGPSGVLFSPANDPFVITVGASGTRGTVTRSDDYPAPWTAWGYTRDGFFKPELAAPGRWMIGAVPDDSALKLLFPTRSIGSGYMWMSGTSFAAPVVSGIAATILSRNPSWTPDQVKGALMLGVGMPSGYSPGEALGVGVVNGTAAMSTAGIANPNAGLNQFVYTNATTGLRKFSGTSWLQAAAGNASWNSASWSSASWSSASWSSASWSSASWSSASWSSASWSSASWSSASWANNAASEGDPAE